MLTMDERAALTVHAANAAIGYQVTLPPALFQKLLNLAYQAEAQNAGPSTVYFGAPP